MRSTVHTIKTMSGEVLTVEQDKHEQVDYTREGFVTIWREQYAGTKYAFQQRIPLFNVVEITTRHIAGPGEDE